MVRRALVRPDIDPALCPICGESNKCISTTGEKGPCWCRSETFSFDLLVKAGTGKACVCQRCLRDFEAQRAAASQPGFPEIVD